ncbi:stage III sporulation protein AB [Ruminococcus sp.]|uniref:stage III sporulation protein AB n=1 Tax=Ruminococcus sp. TaxID=41978 RepID=UPI001B428055|nr:stage III sporulation protein AB [Ruminococcus sp.]MBP5430925.1 stage III sporulation protein AB [Ruminococcus sp.]
MLIRISAVILIILGGAFFGADRSEKLKKRVDLCRDIEKMLYICEYSIKSNDEDVYGITKRIEGADLRGLCFIKNIPLSYNAGANFRTDWERAVFKSQIPDEEKNILIEFGAVLGTSDTERQLRTISAFINEVHALFEQRHSEYMKKGKLYRTLGMLTGIMIGIIII